MEATFVVVGGGIAGVSCAETLSFLEPEEKILLVSESSLIKTVTNLQAITRTLTRFDVEEKDTAELTKTHPNVTVINDILSEINEREKTIKISKGLIRYKYLCICTGAKPKLIPQAVNQKYVLGIRDTDSVDVLVEKLNKSKQIVIVGNGGIASELVYKIQDVNVHWVIKDRHISATFIDPGAAEFFQPVLQKTQQPSAPTPSKRMRYREEKNKKSGAALGPDWYKNLEIRGSNEGLLSEAVKLHCETEIANIIELKNAEYPLEVHLTNNEKLQCDLVISATGVTPHVDFLTCGTFESSEDGGIKVNEYMQTSIAAIYAAGDVCSANWPHAKHWFQMKLWTQARHMGCYAAKCMSAALNDEQILQDFCFEMFAHSTNLFGFKVILLGLYNGQKLGRNYEILLRMTRGHEYIKFVLENNKLQGAVLIGDTDLEETCENLILNQLDLSPYGDDILNPDVDIEDYFD